MSEDLRCHHDVEAKRKAIELIGRGCGYGAADRALGLPNDTVRGWLYIAQAVGIEDFLDGKKRYTSYAFETKLAAARAVVDEGMTKVDAMAAFGIASLSPLKQWCKAYREGGAEALRPKPKGRPRGAKARPRPRTREDELETRVRKLEAENAYLKKLAALRAEETLRTGSRPRW